ncbi:hypothetical protein L2E82_12084 [Cichorium intybus]|uniref:Uncharacterized protein n=1 Tax=Cichorium intybus TaxID=13427 RepID=A0ACB9GH32_CICIN|nr:hypothetical protein L2E82_12084 [Cichorium intybus]
MTTTMITDLNPGDGDKHIEIKVIRKWVSYGRKVECCYIFLDKNGDAIEACRAAELKNIPDDDFPIYYFDFFPYDQLGLRLDDHRVLIDYVGRIEDIYHLSKPPAKPLLKIKIENLREKIIEATFWDEAAKSFDKEA